MSRPIQSDAIFCGDNLSVLQQIESESVDLIYLDPPFNSNAVYHMDNRPMFNDAWRWDDLAEQRYAELVGRNDKIGRYVEMLRMTTGEESSLSYLVFMLPRLQEMHRILSATGSFYLHCDPSASHLLRVGLDVIFGPKSFRSEIIWRRSSAHSFRNKAPKQHGRIHDVIFYYTKGKEWTWNQQYTPYSPEYVKKTYNNVDPETGRLFAFGDLSGPGGASKGAPYFEFMGITRYWRYSLMTMQRMLREGKIIQTAPGVTPRFKRFLDEMKGIPLQDMWSDIPALRAAAKEQHGYPTQKPLALLQRIIATSSNVGDIVLDPFCGSGTTLEAAARCGRRFIGIDRSAEAVAIAEKRLAAHLAPKPVALVPQIEPIMERELMAA